MGTLFLIKELADNFHFECIINRMSDIISIQHHKGEALVESLSLNIIHNRFDLLFSDWSLYLIDGVAVPVAAKGRQGVVGLYLTSLTPLQRDELAARIFEDFPEVEYLEVSHTYTPLEFYSSETYWHIDFPETIEEFDAQLGKKTRYNVKWYPKKMERDKGFIHYRHYITSEVPTQLISRWFEWKKSTHNFTFNQGEMEYLRLQGVTDVYALYITSQQGEERMVAVGMTCDTGDNSYFENFSYDPDYHLYSPGMMIYHHIISEKIKKGIKRFYLSGGELDYKRRYNGIRTEAFTGRIFRHPELLRRAVVFSQKMENVPSFVRKILISAYRHFCLPAPYRRLFKKLSRKDAVV